MTQQHENHEPEALESLTKAEDDSPQSLPPKAWATLIGFAVFVVAFGTCASTFMFN